MFRALVWKEIRAVRLWALISLLGSGWLALSMAFDFESPLLRELDVFHYHASWPIDVSRDDGLVASVAICAVLFGGVMGLWQTMPESAVGTAGFFVHLARRRSRVASAKLAAGALLFAGTVVLPIVIAAAWMPFGWSDFYALWLMLGCGALAYVACLAAGLRELPWKRAAESLSGLVVFGAVIVAAMAVVDSAFGTSVALVAGAAPVAIVWVFSGLAAREF